MDGEKNRNLDGLRHFIGLNRSDGKRHDEFLRD